MEFATQMMLALAVPASLAILVGWLRRRGAISTSAAVRRMQVVERLSLTAQCSLHLVRVDDKYLVVASGSGGCTVLKTADSQ